MTWIPNVEKPGINFYVKYQVKGNESWNVTDIVTDKDYIEIDGISSGKMYEFIVVSLDNTNNQMESDRETVSISTIGMYIYCSKISFNILTNL